MVDEKKSVDTKKCDICSKNYVDLSSCCVCRRTFALLREINGNSQISYRCDPSRGHICQFCWDNV